jgi:hypothetical protein
VLGEGFRRYRDTLINRERETETLLRENYNASLACGGADYATVSALYYDVGTSPDRKEPKYIYTLHYPVASGLYDKLQSELDDIFTNQGYTKNPVQYWLVWTRDQRQIEYTLKQHHNPEPLEITLEISIDPGISLDDWRHP